MATRLARTVLTLAILAASHAPAATLDLVRDKWGVPHIFVPRTLGHRITQLKALGFAQGYATAQDRLVQLEFFRRAGKGKLAEGLGPSFLDMDKETRRGGFTHRGFAARVRRLPGRSRIAFQAFADGVNRYLTEMATDSSKKPAELIALGVTPV